MSQPILDDLPLPFLTLSSETKHIVWANQAMQEWAGRSLKGLKGKSLDSVFTHIDPILDAAERALADLGPVSLHDFSLRQSDQRDRLADITLFPVGDELHFFAQIHTSQPNRSQSSGQAVSTMGRMIAHEIKNPLAGIKGAAQLLLDDVSTDEGQDLISLIVSEIGRIQRLTDRMQTLGVRDPSKTGLVNVHEILTKARQVIDSAYSTGLVLTESYDTSLPLVYGDEDTLMQALLNLIKNAAQSIESSGQDGEITLETTFRTGVFRKTASGAEPVNLPIEIRIIDNGPGIEDAIRDRVFLPFITNKPSGQGLGLSLVAKVAADHGGIVEHQSRPGRTIFSVLLPAPNREDSYEV